MPPQARILMLGTFPPKRERWAMEFYYPNRINDMWRIMGLIFHGDKNHFWDDGRGGFDLPRIKQLLTDKRIALWDTAMAVRRLRDNASDKFLEIVEEIDLATLLRENPTITTVITAGEKATSVVARQAGVDTPAVGQGTPCCVGGHQFTLWRMPSSSRAYPLALEKKAQAYAKVLNCVNET